MPRFILGVLFVLCGFSLPAHALDVKTYIPKNAETYLPDLKLTLDKYWLDKPMPEYFGGLIEQESCVSLTSRRCWSPTSQLKTPREEGAGLGQLTRAYRSNGSLRFDSLSDLRRKHYEALKDLSWTNIYSRPDLQMRSIVLMIGDIYGNLYNITNPTDRMQFTDAAYNGGLAGVYKERRACGLRSDCDPQKWFGNVEKVCLKSKSPLYGDRSACDINREHVYNVFEIRAPKYKPFLDITPPGPTLPCK